MTPLLAMTRPVSLGWLGLAQRLAAAPAQRRPSFAQTEPPIFRSECFAEDLHEPTTPAPTARPAGRRG